MSYLLVNLLSGCALQSPSSILIGDIRIAADHKGEREKGFTIGSVDGGSEGKILLCTHGLVSRRQPSHPLASAGFACLCRSSG